MTTNCQQAARRVSSPGGVRIVATVSHRRYAQATLGRSLGGLDAGGVAETEFGHADLAHLELLHLSGHGQREIAGDPQIARDLVVRDLSGAELPQLLEAQLGAWAELHPRTQFLAVPGVGHPDHL